MENIFLPPAIPIVVKKGSTLVIPITYKDKDGSPIDLTNYQAKLQVRETPNSNPESGADIELTEQSGIDLGGENGTIVITFLSAQTLALDDEYCGTWDLFLIPSESTAFCLLSGTFKVIASTTKV